MNEPGEEVSGHQRLQYIGHGNLAVKIPSRQPAASTALSLLFTARGVEEVRIPKTRAGVAAGVDNSSCSECDCACGCQVRADHRRSENDFTFARDALIQKLP